MFVGRVGPEPELAADREVPGHVGGNEPVVRAGPHERPRERVRVVGHLHHVRVEVEPLPVQQLVGYRIVRVGEVRWPRKLPLALPEPEGEFQADDVLDRVHDRGDVGNRPVRVDLETRGHERFVDADLEAGPDHPGGDDVAPVERSGRGRGAVVVRLAERRVAGFSSGDRRVRRREFAVPVLGGRVEVGAGAIGGGDDPVVDDFAGADVDHRC